MNQAIDGSIRMKQGIRAVIAGCFFGFASSVAGVGDSSVCPAILVDIGTGTDTDRTLVCRGAAIARDFLASHGIEVRKRIKLRLYHAALNAGDSHIGSYDSAKDRIDLLTFEQARRRASEDPLFGMRMNESLYLSVVVHEVAHAIAGQNFQIQPASLIAHEYIAYVAQLSTMDVEARSQILRRYHTRAFAGVEEMSTIYYALDPSGFGVKAFRHYQSLSDPDLFIQGLISGAIVPASPDMEWQ